MQQHTRKIFKKRIKSSKPAEKKTPLNPHQLQVCSQLYSLFCRLHSTHKSTLKQMCLGIIWALSQIMHMPHLPTLKSSGRWTKLAEGERLLQPVFSAASNYHYKVERARCGGFETLSIFRPPEWHCRSGTTPARGSLWLSGAG